MEKFGNVGFDNTCSAYADDVSRRYEADSWELRKGCRAHFARARRSSDVGLSERLRKGGAPSGATACSSLGPGPAWGMTKSGPPVYEDDEYIGPRGRGLRSRRNMNCKR